MRISDWSSDVCSSDLYFRRPILPELSSDRRCHLADSAETMSAARDTGMNIRVLNWMISVKQPWAFSDGNDRGSNPLSSRREIGRASWRERGCQYVKISVDAGALKKKS